MKSKQDAIWELLVFNVSCLVFGGEGSSTLYQNLISEALKNKGLYQDIITILNRE